jgi:hypothetical protein
MCPGSLFPTNTFNPLGGFFLTFLTYAFKQNTNFTIFYAEGVRPGLELLVFSIAKRQTKGIDRATT